MVSPEEKAVPVFVIVPVRVVTLPAVERLSIVKTWVISVPLLVSQTCPFFVDVESSHVSMNEPRDSLSGPVL